jgi:serine protease Do
MGWLGVGIQPITDSLRESLGLKSTEGALVSQVFDNGPAERAGVEPGDVIVQVGSKKIKDIHELIRHVGRLRPGQKAKVRVVRGGKKKNLFVTLGTRPGKLAELEEKPEEEGMGKLGLKLADLNPRLARRFRISGQERGALIVEVAPGSLAAQAGLLRGDIIVQVDRQDVPDVETALLLLDKAEAKGVALLLVKRRDRSVFVGLNLK